MLFRLSAERSDHLSYKTIMVASPWLEQGTPASSVQCSTIELGSLGPNDTIWTCNLMFPKHVLYQIELHSVKVILIDHHDIGFFPAYQPTTFAPWYLVFTLTTTLSILFYGVSDTMILIVNLGKRIVYFTFSVTLLTKCIPWPSWTCT